MKNTLLVIANFLGYFWRIIPEKLRKTFIVSLFILESRDPSPIKGLKRIFILRDKLDWIINERAIVAEGGRHPKHRLIGYHKFFIDHIVDGDKVLDVGCGIGLVSQSIANAHKNCKVLGIDMDEPRLSEAKASINLDNLKFVYGDATKLDFHGHWDVVVLSNVLEHIEARVPFLSSLVNKTKAKKILIRVPFFEREWQIAMKKELRLDYRSDSDHKIEHSLGELLCELNLADLKVAELNTIWGEIWVECLTKYEDQSLLV